MPINRRILSQDAAVAAGGGGDAADGLIMHLDANDEDSIESGGANTGNGSGTWFDISSHDLNIPRIAPSTNLILDLDFSNTSSYSGSGTNVEDVSENNPEADGTINGSGTYASDTRGYYDFGSLNSNFISIGSLGDFSTTSDLSFEVWVYTQANTTEQNLFGTSHSGTGVGYIFAVVNNPIQYNISDRPTGAFARATSAETKTDVWQHIVCTWDVSALKWTMYVDGTLATGTNTPGSGTASTPTDSADVLKLNATHSGFGHTGWQGRFNSLRIYNRVLTASEVAQNFRADCFLSFSSIYNTNLRFNLEANNYTSGTWTDSEGNHNATIVVDGSNAVFDKELNNFFTLDASGTYGDHIEIAHDNLFNMEADCSWEFMFRRDSTTNEQQIAYKGNGLHYLTAGANTRWFLNYATQSNFGFYFYNYDTASFVTSGNINSNNLPNEFEHIIITWDVSEKRLHLYYNGILTENQNTVGGGTVGDHGSTTDKLYLGRANGYTAQPSLVGAFAIARFHTSTLTAEQAAQNYLATKNDYPSGINGDIQGPTFQGSATPYHFDFNGSTNYVDVAYTTLGDRDFTVTMYIKFDDLTAQRYIFTKYMANPSGQYGMLIQSQASASVILWQMYDTGNHPAISLNSSTSLSTGTYYHLAFVYVHRTSATIYVDGSSDGTTSWSTGNPFGQNSAQVRFARYQSTTTSLDGEIGQIKIFDKALSSSEVTAEYDATKTPYS